MQQIPDVLRGPFKKFHCSYFVKVIIIQIIQTFFIARLQSIPPLPSLRKQKNSPFQVSV